MISLDDIKAHLNVTTDIDDELIRAKLAAATAWVSAYTGIAADAAEIPASVLEAVRQIAAHLYQNRELAVVGISAQSLPFGALELLSSDRKWAF